MTGEDWQALYLEQLQRAEHLAVERDQLRARRSIVRRWTVALSDGARALVQVTGDCCIVEVLCPANRLVAAGDSVDPAIVH